MELVVPPLQKRTAPEASVPLSLTSSTHSVKTFASFLREQKLKAITARDNAETTLVPSVASPKASIRCFLLPQSFLSFLSSLLIGLIRKLN